MAEKPGTLGYNVITTGWRVPVPEACKRSVTESIPPAAFCCHSVLLKAKGYNSFQVLGWLKPRVISLKPECRVPKA